jgi:hypothetical protein
LTSVALGVLIAGVGLADIPAYLILAATAVLTTALVALVHAFSTEGLRSKNSALLVAVASLILFIAGSGAYMLWEQGRDNPDPRYVFILRGASESQMLVLSAYPGGPPVEGAMAPLFGGQPYQFQCAGLAPDQSAWLQLSATQYWAPAQALQQVGGLESSLPDCQDI